MKDFQEQSPRREVSPEYFVKVFEEGDVPEVTRDEEMTHFEYPAKNIGKGFFGSLVLSRSFSPPPDTETVIAIDSNGRISEITEKEAWDRGLYLFGVDAKTPSRYRGDDLEGVLVLSLSASQPDFVAGLYQVTEHLEGLSQKDIYGTTLSAGTWQEVGHEKVKKVLYFPHNPTLLKKLGLFLDIDISKSPGGGEAQ